MPRSHAVTVSLVLLAGLLAVAGAVVWILGLASVPPPVPAESIAESPIAARHAPESTARAEMTSERTAVPETEGEPPPIPVFGLRGRVVDAAGTPLPDVGVGVMVEDGEPPTTGRSDASGSFLLSASALPCYVVVDDPKWTTLRMGQVREDAPLTPALVIAAPAVVVRGVVVDRSDKPLAGAQIDIRLEKGAQASLPGDPSRGFRGEWHAESGADGAFVFDRAPAVARARLSTRLPEFKTDEKTLDLPPPGPLRIVLEAEVPGGPVIEGTVVRPDGAPAPGASVSFGSARARADVQGHFRLVAGWFDEATPLVAAARRFAPAVLAGYGARIDPGATKLPPERIVLAGPELSITGRVLLASGAPAKGWSVDLADPTPVDPGGPSADVAEGQAGYRTQVRTDARGAFELAGLSDRSYVLLASGRDRSSRAELAVRSDPVPAGSRDVMLLAPDGQPGETISGRVVSTQGTPVAGARVGLGRTAFRGSAAEYGMQGRFRTICDPDGRFQIEGVPAGLAIVVVAGETILPVRLPLESGAPRSGITLKVSRRRELSFDGSAGSPPPDLLRALAGGAPATIWRLAGTTPQPAPLARLDGGTSGPLAVGEDVRELVLYRGCRELGRVPVAFGTEGGTRVTWP